MVAVGRYDDPEAEAHVVRTIIERRDKIVRHYLALMNPIDGFTVSGSGRRAQVTFSNLGVEAGLTPDSRYAYEWFRFDNSTGELQSVDRAGSAEGPTIPVPDVDVAYLTVRIRTLNADFLSWDQPVDVTLRRGSTLTVVGVARSPAAD